ncbi:MAG: pilus assembly protein TadG-related protein [Micrococcales bacterium]|nr:pilus assembly protein TadG-related protein [Micrococcales bacterium]
MRTGTADRRGSRARGDDGHTGVLVLMCVPVLIAGFGVVVDLGGRYEAGNQVAWTAQQAARAAAQRLDAGGLQEGYPPTSWDLDQAAAAGQEVIGAAGMTGTVTFVDGEVLVTTQTTYTPKILGLRTWTVDGDASVRMVRGISSGR